MAERLEAAAELEGALAASRTAAGADRLWAHVAAAKQAKVSRAGASAGQPQGGGGRRMAAEQQQRLGSQQPRERGAEKAQTTMQWCNGRRKQE